MDLSKIKPIYLVLLVVIGFTAWKLPEALQHSQDNKQSQQELGSYLEVKDNALTANDSSEITSFLQTLEEVFSDLDAVTASDCQFSKSATKPRILDWNLLWYVYQVDATSKSKDLFFDKVSTLNSQNPFSNLNLTVGDGFTQDIGNAQWNPGTLTYIRNLKKEKTLFIAKLEDFVAPSFNGDDNFQTGVATVGVWACDLSTGQVLCKHSLTVKSDDSFGLPKKTAAMNNQLRLELLEKTVKKVEGYCGSKSNG